MIEKSESVEERLASEPIHHFSVQGNMIEKYGHQGPDQTAREKCWVAEISKWSYSPPHCTIRPASGTLSGSMDGAGDILSHQIPPSLHSVLITQILLIKRQPCPNQVHIKMNQNQNSKYSRTPTNHLIGQPGN